MSIIKLKTRIEAPVEVCFNLARSIDLHVQSMAGHREKAIAGVTRGLIGLNETVTWKARHLGWTWRMTVKITELNSPVFFADQMLEGPFRMMRHYHSFKTDGGHTLMTDEFIFRSPCGWLGALADLLLLKPYMRRLLLQRNKTLKKLPEASYNEVCSNLSGNLVQAEELKQSSAG